METNQLSAIAAYDVFRMNCPSRQVFDLVGERWAGLLLLALHGRPQRFSALRRQIEGVSQKMLTQTLRALERDGLVHRTVYPAVPVRVEYALTPLGQTLREPLKMLTEWSVQHIADVLAAREEYDARAERDG